MLKREESEARFSVKIDSFKYPDETLALSEVKFEVRRGEFVGILGANGSGKTTLLKIMDGLIRDFKGRVKLDGKDIRTLSPKEIYKVVGLVFQNPEEQLFAATVFEDVAFGPINLGISEEEIARRVGNALREVEMAGVENRPIHTLSFGQKKRACIAGLLAMGHEILLLDEPTGELDPMGEHKMMKLLTKLNKENKVSIVMVTHSVDLVPLFLDRIYILNKGSIIKSGRPEDIFSAPQDLEDMELRLPQIAELIYRLKYQDNLPFEKIPFTVGEARSQILEVMQNEKIKI